MAAFNRTLQKIAKIIYKCFFVFGTIAFTFLIVILFCNVFSRNLLSGAIAWVEELARFVFTWMMFLGIAIGVYYKKHLGVEFLVAKYPKSVQKAVGIFSDILMLILFAVLTIYGFKYSKSTMNMRTPIMNIRYGILYLCVPLCGIFSGIYSIINLVDRFFGEHDKKEIAGKEESEA